MYIYEPIMLFFLFILCFDLYLFIKDNNQKIMEDTINIKDLLTQNRIFSIQNKINKFYDSKLSK